MAFNTYYNPFYGQQNYQNQMQMPQQMTAQPTTDERIWVQSESAAENYLMSPNSFVRLWDSNHPVFYERRTDATGRPFPMEIYEYKKRESDFNNANSEINFRINDLNERIKAIEEKIGGSHAESNANDTAV